MSSGLSLLLAAASLANLGTTALDVKKFDRIIETCTKEHGTSTGEFYWLLGQQKLPETPKLKCTLDCYLAKRGYLKDGKLDWAAMKVSNKEDYEDYAEILTKADEIIDNCQRKVSTGGKCELGRALLACVYAAPGYDGQPNFI